MSTLWIAKIAEAATLLTNAKVENVTILGSLNDFLKGVSMYLKLIIDMPSVMRSSGIREYLFTPIVQRAVEEQTNATSTANRIFPLSKEFFAL